MSGGLTFGSVCSGIEAASVAWHPLGWRCAFVSEIEAFPRAVLAHHYPDTPLHGDFTTIKAGEYEPIDLLVGGTPCQSFSVAGLRGGLGDDRGNLALEYLRLADRLRPRWVVWENVPGVFSSLSHDAADPCPPDIDLDGDDGPPDGTQVVVEDSYDADESHALACFLAGLSELGFGWAYRVLDAQYAGVPQRRRRIFVVGYLGDWRRAAAVLFERHSLSGDPAPRREAGQTAPTIPSRSAAGGGLGTDFDCDGGLIQAFGGNDTRGPIEVSTALNAHGGPHGRMDFESETFVAFNLRGREGGAMPEMDELASMRAASGGSSRSYLAFGITRDALDRSGEGSGETPGERAGLGIIADQAQTIKAKGPGAVAYASAVRRLTPVECERLQGFPDGYTAIAWRGKPASECPDGPRYKALGNSMAVPVMAWIGERIAAVEAIPLTAQREAA